MLTTQFHQNWIYLVLEPSFSIVTLAFGSTEKVRALTVIVDTGYSTVTIALRKKKIDQNNQLLETKDHFK